MKRKLSLVLAGVMVMAMVMTLIGCATGATNPTGGTPTSPSQGTTGPTSGTTGPTSGATGATNAQKRATDLMQLVSAAKRPSDPSVPDPALRKAYNRFAAALLKASTGNPGNVMVSPASVFLALSMTLNGADAETRDAMIKVLAESGITVDQINQASRDWTTLLAKTGDKTRVSIANSIWFDQEFSPDKSFLQANADHYGAGARKLDFRDPATVGIINGWVKDATQGTIDKIVDEIRPDTMMYLINAIYFKSDWKTPFDKASTRKQVFHAPGSSFETDFMHRTGNMGWLAGNDASGVALPYENDQFAFFALLPDGSVTPREWLERQDDGALFETIAGLMAQKADQTVSLAIPKFESRYEDSLKDELSKLGMAIAFDSERADFSLMKENREKDLFIGDVRHKTFVRVDEKGTEAAAVTSVEMRTSGLPHVDQQLALDRPFLYGIVDLKSGMPLFVGIMEKPAV